MQIAIYREKHFDKNIEKFYQKITKVEICKKKEACLISFS